MFKQKFVLEVKGKDERLYRFECDATAPLGELNDVLFTMKSEVVKQLAEQHEKDRPEEKSEDKCKEKSEKDCKKEEGKK